jgi:mRNA interferase RelE/StbE
MDEVKPQPLTGGLGGLYKFRAGDYRVIDEILREERTILIHAVGHRREIYRTR